MDALDDDNRNSRRSELVPSAFVREAKRNPAAFDAIYQQYLDPVYRYCLRRTGNRERAEDATASVFLKAMAGLHTYKEDKASFRSWLFAIAHHVLVDMERSEGAKQTEQLSFDPTDHASDLEAHVLDAEADREVVRVLQVLPVDQRRVLEFRLAGLTTSEIAAALSISEGAVRASQYRAAKRLRVVLADDPTNWGPT